MRHAIFALLVLVPSVTASADDCQTSGAIAYSASTGRIGWSYGYDAPWQARRAAIDACAVADCTSQVWEQGEFAALVKSAGGAVSVGWDEDLDGAEARAIRQCYVTGGRGCHVERWVEN
ncbi:MAG TPA: DUF4189 domain-containing protein [Kofleriaceae bacterium]|nr:DUF4189 domain-containing protein [Kofleriaceae bacterium]